jgi:hypothetical protein
MTRLGHFATHLLHRKCSWCWQDGFARGFHRASVESERRERLRDSLWEQGVNPRQMEASVRERIAESERWAA